MMDQQIASRLRADLFLLHAPGVHDFRERDDVPCAPQSDSVNVTPGCEMSPIGWFSVRQRPARPGLNAVTGAASGVARWPDQDVHRSSRPRWTLHC
jgi:clorobiocin biosynthesis protein CloN6